jgi:hypothetical protein
MTISVSDTRVSFIWFERTGALLTDPAAETPWPFLSKPAGYAEAFDRARIASPYAQGLTPPWPSKGIHKFWMYYLGQADLGRTEGTTAWKLSVPLQVRVPFKLLTHPGKVGVKGFLYPHGNAFVVNVRLAGNRPLDETLDSLIGIRRDKSITLDLGTTLPQMKMDQLAAQGLAWLRQEVLGEKAPPGEITATPYSVVTFISLTGADASASIAQGDPIHRALQACTSWSPTWKIDALRQITEMLADIDQPAPPGHAMYVDKHGQATWFPEKGKVVKGKGKQQSLTCYHNNQFFGALQVESLAALMQLTSEMLDNGAALSPRHGDCARRGADTLGRMYSGEKTYKSGSIRAHIDRAGFVGATNKVRAWNARGPLF